MKAGMREGGAARGSHLARRIPLLAALLFVVRPAAVWASTRGSSLSREEKIFLAKVIQNIIFNFLVADRSNTVEWVFRLRHRRKKVCCYNDNQQNRGVC